MQKYISDIIKIRGFIPLEEFISLSLCHHKHGYYAKENPIMKDFITSPEISNAFGIIFASYIIDNIIPIAANVNQIHFIEFGGGTGKLAFDILNFLESISKLNILEIEKLIPKIKFNSIEFSEKLINLQKKTLDNISIEKSFFPDFSTFKKNIKNSEDDIFIFISNEFFDAIPIKQFIKKENDFFEIIITEKNNSFIFEQIKINSENIKLISSYFEDGKNDFFEMPLVEFNILQEIADIMKNSKSIFLTADYGFLQRPNASTLQGIFNGKKTNNILENAGNADITHLVDFNLMKSFFTENKIKSQILTQREFLIQNGIMNLINGENSNGINRLISSDQMGTLFKVLIAKSF